MDEPLRTEIRTAEAADAEQLSQLMRDTFFAAYGHCSSPDNVATFLAKHYSAARQLAEITDPNLLTFIASGPGDAWAGFAQLRTGASAPGEVRLSKPAEVARFYFSPSHHGNGFAGQLMQRLMHEAETRGSDGLWLNVWQQAPQPIRFYTKHGFRIVGTSVFPVGADAQQDWLMQRDFAAA